jgi:hypothetical protein
LPCQISTLVQDAQLPSLDGKEGGAGRRLFSIAEQLFVKLERIRNETGRPVAGSALLGN